MNKVINKSSVPGMLVLLTAVISTLCSCFLFSSHSSWTIMVYLDADNSLDSFAIKDLNEMETTNLAGTGINVIVLLDRSPMYSYTWDDTRAFQIEYDSGGFNYITVSKELDVPELGLKKERIEEINMGQPAACSAFIDFCQRVFPADNYSLIFWNHGAGWEKSIQSITNSSLETSFFVSDSDSDEAVFKEVCTDETDDDSLFTKEIGDAIAGKGIDVVGFDACLEGVIELAYEIRNDASYMIGSQDLEPGDGWSYDEWLSDFAVSGLKSVDLCNSIVDAYASNYSSEPGATLSAIDLSQLDNVMENLNNFSDQLDSEINDLNYAAVRDLLNNDENVETIYANTPSGRTDKHLDIYDMAQVVQSAGYASDEATALMLAIDNAVITEWHNNTNNPNAHGLSIYFVSLGNFIADRYMNGFIWEHPLAFVTDSTWVSHYTYAGTPGAAAPGLLYKLWYQYNP